MCLSGCNTTRAHSSPVRSSAVKASSPVPLVAKHPPRESAYSIYNNPAYGLSFRYPRTYLLDEDFDTEDPSILEAQRQLAASQPGAALVSIVIVPPDAYPNTTFRSATLQIVVNPTVTRETCQSFVVLPDDDVYTSGATAAQGPIFQWRQSGSAGMGTGYLNRDYAAFSNGACYEFFVEIIIGSNPDDDPRIKPADEARILHVLDKIVATTQTRASTIEVPPKPLPVVNSFTVESIPHPALQNAVRVSWNISGAAENEVFLRANCPGQIPGELNPLPDPIPSESQPAQPSPTDPPVLEEPPDRYSRKTFFRLESIFACGSFTPIPPHSGTFRLQIESHSAEPVSFTLFVSHLPYFSRSPK